MTANQNVVESMLKAGARIRFAPASAFARELCIPREAEGEIQAQREVDGDLLLDVWVEGTGMLFGVPVGEVRRV